MVMSILSGNLTEGQTKGADMKPTSSQLKTATISKMDVTSKETIEIHPTASKEISAKDKPHIFLQFTFAMEQLIICLYTGGSEQVSFKD